MNKIEIDNFFKTLEVFGIKLGLEQTKKLFKKLGNPEKKLNFIHIAGTNGKGSVGSLIAAGLTQAGYKTGFYTSPHLIDVRERFRIDGNVISQEQLSNIIEKLIPVIDFFRKKEISHTYFEVTTAIAATYFEKEKCDFVVWETGLGGRFDATNIVNPELSIITGISIDHSKFLGNDIENIAFEKAGIIKEETPVICGIMPTKALNVIKKIATEKKSKIIETETKMNHEKSENEFHKRNRLIAKIALKELSSKYNFKYDINSISKSVTWPARLQFITEKIIIDGAHNPEAATLLKTTLIKKFPDRKYSIILTTADDKEGDKVINSLAEIANEFIFPQIKTSRKMRSPDILKSITEKNQKIPSITTENLKNAMAIVKSEHILITGSLYLAGEALKMLVPEENVFKELIDSKHPKLDENAYAGLAYIELFYGDVQDALKNYEIAQEFIDETDVALLHNVLLAKIASNKEIEGKYVKQLEEYISKGVTSQTQGNIDRLYMLYLLYLSYTDNVTEAINLSKNYHYDFDESSDILMYMVETILSLAEKRPMYGEEYLDKALSLIKFILNFEEKLSSDFIFYLYSKEAWIFYDKGKNYLNQSINYLENLKEKYPNSIVVLRDLIIMMIENGNEKHAYEYCLKIQNYTSNINILPQITVDEFEYILGFSFWVIGEIEKSDECFRRTTYDENQKYSIVYDWLNVPISNKNKLNFFEL